MANNCLMTQLKSVVNNDNLEVLGTTKLKFYADPNNRNQNRIFYLSSDPASKIEIISGDAHFEDANGNNLGTTLPSATYDDAVYISGSCELRAYKYDLKYALSDNKRLVVNGDFNFVKYNNTDGSRGIKLAFLQGGNVSDLATCNVRELIINGYYNTEDSYVVLPANVVGDIEAVKNNNYYVFSIFQPEVGVTGVSLVDVYGNGVEAFKNMTILMNLVIRTTKIVGSVEDLVVGQLIAGRESGTSLFVDLGQGFTFNNTYTGGLRINFNNNNVTVVSGSTTVGTYNKSTGEWTYA